MAPVGAFIGSYFQYRSSRATAGVQAEAAADGRMNTLLNNLRQENERMARRLEQAEAQILRLRRLAIRMVHALDHVPESEEWKSVKQEAYAILEDEWNGGSHA